MRYIISLVCASVLVLTVSATASAQQYMVASLYNNGSQHIIPQIFPTLRACQYWIKEKGGADIVMLGTHLGDYMCVPYTPMQETVLEVV